MRAYDFSCPGCGTALVVLDRNLGGTYNCSKCGKKSRIPDNLTPIDAEVRETTGPMGLRAWEIKPRTGNAGRRSRGPRKSVRKSSRGTGWLIGCVALGVIVVVGAVGKGFSLMKKLQASKEQPARIVRFDESNRGPKKKPEWSNFGTDPSPIGMNSADHSPVPGVNEFAQKRSGANESANGHTDPSSSGAGSSENVARSGGQQAATHAARQSYPISIPIPRDAARVETGTPLQEGTRLKACWASRWLDVHVLRVHDDGTVDIRWLGYGPEWDTRMIREELIISKNDRPN